MKQRACAAILSVFIVVAASAQQDKQAAPVAVPDEATAVRIAEKGLAKVYGKKAIQRERPFTATLSNGIWHVTGTLYCKDAQGNLITDACVGGVAMADIRRSDGRVLKTGHSM